MKFEERPKWIQNVVTFVLSSSLYLTFPFLSGVVIHMEVDEGITDGLACTWKYSGSPKLGIPGHRGMLVQGSPSAVTNAFPPRLQCHTPKPSQHHENA